MILAVDTCLDRCALALVRDGETLAISVAPMTRGHAEAIAPMAHALMAAAGVHFSALTRVAVTTGPGSFTGVRVGLAFARGLALARSIPAIGVSTLEALALGSGVRAGLILGGGGGYGGAWLDGATLRAPERLEDEAALNAFLGDMAGLGAALCGPDVARFAGRGLGIDVVEGPDPAALGRLAAGRDPAEAPARPTYLKAPDAKPANPRP